jgi:hypothetical protein
MTDADRFHLLHGPDQPPRCRVGTPLFGALHGLAPGGFF